MPTLTGKTALVTGASRGMGRASALALAAAGAQVLVHYGRGAKKADTVVAEIRKGGGRADAIAIVHSGRGAFLRAKSGWCCKASGSRRHEGATIGRCHINLPVQPTRTHFRIRRQERGMAALLDRSLNVLAAAQSNAALGEELLSFAGKFVISR
jgi:NAD(P)-dependent dehydrogenase (short-subunit alcohol dehydrogenase family)